MAPPASHSTEQLWLLPGAEPAAASPAEPPDAQGHQHRELDRLCKTVMGLDHGRVLRWLFTAELCRLVGLPAPVDCPALLEQLDKDFAEVKRAADYLLKVALAGLVFLLHWEFQRRVDPLMAWRMHGYQGAAQKKHEHPVLSLLLLVQSDQRVPLLVAEHVVGPLSRTGWVSLSLRHLVQGWPERTDSPMAEMLRALVQGRPEVGYLKGFVERLRGLGLGEEDCRDVILMLSFLLQIRDGDYSDRYRALVAEVMTMLQLEDSWVYQAGIWRGEKRGEEKGEKRGEEKGEKKGLGTGILTVLNARGLPVSEPLRQQILACGDIERLNRWLARAATAGSAEDALAEP